MPMLKSHTHSQFAKANASPKIAKEYVQPTLTFQLNNQHLKTKQNVKSTTYNNVYKTQLLEAFREVFVYLESTPNFLFGYIQKRKLNIKIKNSARAISEKLAFIYTLRFIHKTVVKHFEKNYRHIIIKLSTVQLRTE